MDWCGEEVVVFVEGDWMYDLVRIWCVFIWGNGFDLDLVVIF